MDQYLSTYRKDFVWPHVRAFPIQAITETDSKKVLMCKSVGNGHLPCTYAPETNSSTAPKENSCLPVGEAHQWNCLGPTKLYPGKNGLRYDTTNTYLKKLQEKYPYLYNVIQSAPPDDMIRRVNQDRLRTTYQIDYGHMDEHRDWKKLLSEAGINSDQINKNVSYNIRPPDYSDTTTNRPGRFEDPREGLYEPGEVGRNFQEDTNYRDGFRYNAREFQDSREAAKNSVEPSKDDSGRAPREIEHSREATKKNYASNDESSRSGRDAHEDYREAANIHKAESGGKDSRNIKSVGGVEAFVRSTENKAEGKAPEARRSEYQEVIGQTGYDIIRDKMHRHGARSGGRSLIERIIMRCRAV